jgi:hypothetical protein
MKLHGNAALTPKQRLRLARRVAEEGWSLGEAAMAAEVSERTARKCARRYRAEGEAGLCDRSSAPSSVPHRTPEDRVEAIAALRRLRMTGAEIAGCLGWRSRRSQRSWAGSDSGSSRGSSRPSHPTATSALVPANWSTSMSRSWVASWRPGTGSRPRGRRRRRRGRNASGSGWPVGSSSMSASTTPPAWPSRGPARRAGDDGDRLSPASGRLLPSPRSRGRAGDDRQRLRLPLDRACHRLPHTRDQAPAHPSLPPHTNGKAERFIRTMLGEWAYGAIYGSSAERAAALDGWLVFYNWRRPHGSLSKRPPGTRLRELNNLAGSHLGHGRSLPGFMIPPGSRRSLTARRISTPRPPASASIHGRCARPMA